MTVRVKIYIRVSISKVTKYMELLIGQNQDLTFSYNWDPARVPCVRSLQAEALLPDAGSEVLLCAFWDSPAMRDAEPKHALHVYPENTCWTSYLYRRQESYF